MLYYNFATGEVLTDSGRVMGMYSSATEAFADFQVPLVAVNASAIS